jgi:hypothetical protein
MKSTGSALECRLLKSLIQEATHMIWAVISTLIGVAGGILAMSSLFVGKGAAAQEKLAKLAQYQGWIGLTMFGWGVWEIIDCILSLGILKDHPILFVFWLLMAVADFTVGLILGFGMISTYAFRGNAMAIEKGNALRATLVKFQVPLGGLAVLTSIGYTVFYFI